jgi:hypothetical protein
VQIDYVAATCGLVQAIDILCNEQGDATALLEGG